MTGKSVDQVQFKQAYNQKPDLELVIAKAARDFLKHKKDNHLKDNRIIDFFHGVRAYFLESRPRGYKTFFMLNSTEHEISTAHKN